RQISSRGETSCSDYRRCDLRIDRRTTSVRCSEQSPHMRPWISRVSIAAALGLLVPKPAICQEGRLPLSEILTNLFGNTIVLAPRSTPEVPSHAAHFKPSPEQLRTPEQFNQQIVTLLSTFPFGSSSGGFTYKFDPSLGTFS